MAWLFGEEKFGQYTYEHWFDEKQQIELEKDAEDARTETASADCNTTPDTPLIDADNAITDISQENH